MGNAIDNMRHLIDGYGWRDSRDMQDFIDAADTIDMQYVELPKDADGVPIHLGDEVYQVKGGWVYTVKSISFYPDNTTVTFECEHGFGSDSAHNVRHYHEPTVEDVLTEFGIDWEYEDNCEDRAALLAEYAAKLQLAGDAAGPNELAMAYHVGYDDALAKRKPDANKVVRQ